jgi:hypothetical protein
VAGILQTIGIVTIAIGGISAIIIGSETNSFMFGLLTFIYAGVSGMLFVGFAEVIRLLTKIDAKIAGKESVSNPNGPIQQSIAKKEDNPKNRQVKKHEFEEILDFYKQRGISINRVVVAPKHDFFLVTLDDGSDELIELGGFRPEVTPQEKWDQEMVNWYEGRD